MSKNNKKQKTNTGKINNNISKSENKKPGKLLAGDMLKGSTDYSIPRFGFKSAFLLLGTAILSSIIIPVIVQSVGLSFDLTVVICNTFLTSYALAYARYFIESKRGYCKKFWINYTLFAISFGIIGFLWTYLNAYI